MIRSLTIQISSTSGPQVELEVLFDRWDNIGTASERPQFQYAVRVPGFGTDDEGTIAYGHDLRLGSGDQIDHVQAMGALLTFLESDAEKYQAQLGRTTNTSAEALMHRTGESYLFDEQTAEWAYESADELALARAELSLHDKRAAQPDSDALDAIAGQLSGVSWNADTVERVAAIVGATGRKIEEPDTGRDVACRTCDDAGCDDCREPQRDSRLDEPEEQRSGLGLAATRDEWFAVQRRYLVGSAAQHHGSMKVGVWGDVVSNGIEANMREQFEWGARGGTTAEGQFVAPLAKSLGCDERLVRVRKGKTVEVLDEQLFEPRRVLFIHETPDGRRWMVRRYETMTPDNVGSMRAGANELDAIQLDGVGLSPVYAADELDALRGWLDGDEDEARRVGAEPSQTCACSTGARMRGQLGNVHSDDERA